MNNSFGGWEFIAKNYDLDTVVDYIVTGKNSSNASQEDWLNSFFEIINLFKKSNNLSILDFGCGVGRNILPFSQQHQDIKFTGYDSDSMLEKANEYIKTVFKKSVKDFENVRFLSDWNKIKDQQFNLVFACLVFQHLSEETLIKYINDIKNMTDYLVVYGRRLNDEFSINSDHKYTINYNNIYHKNTWDILHNVCGLVPNNNLHFKNNGDAQDHDLLLYKL